jgi:hypothetical protein
VASAAAFSAPSEERHLTGRQAGLCDDRCPPSQASQPDIDARVGTTPRRGAV